jgi:hypothetical protein
MKITIKFLGMAILGVGLFISRYANGQTAFWDSLKDRETIKQLKQFVAVKTEQANMSAMAEGKRMAPEFKPFFVAAEKGDWLTVSNMFQNLMPRTGQVDIPSADDLFALRNTQLQALKEIWGAYDAFCDGNEKYSAAFGNDIIESIPPGSIYFGGTDPGRFIVTALQKSHVDGDPFFTLTQNALADGSYLDYLHSMYDAKIYVPSSDDSQKCFQDYTEDAQQRLKSNKLKPGEDVKVDANGQVQVSGQVAVMEINGLLAKTIFDKNTNHEFYVEESFPLDWMYPYLEPHGLIMKINRQPLPALSGEIVRRDSDYWTKYLTPMIGDWLNADTTVEEIAAFAEKIYVKKDFSRFTGDPQFVQNEYSCGMFSKLRSSQADLYAWRAQHTADAGEKKRMNDAADFAFRQAWALCPYSAEALYRYVNLLLSEGQIDDAVLIAETTERMPELVGQYGEDQFHSLTKQLKQWQQQSKKK